MFFVVVVVSILLIYSFTAFVTKLHGGGQGAGAPRDTTTMKGGEGRSSTRPDFSIRTSQNSGVKRISSSHSLGHLAHSEDESVAHDADSEASSFSSELFEFDVYEREGYDKVIQTVTGGQHQEDFARQVCNILEIFESLSPGRYVDSYLTPLGSVGLDGPAFFARLTKEAGIYLLFLLFFQLFILAKRWGTWCAASKP